MTFKRNVVVYMWHAGIETNGEHAGEYYMGKRRFLVFSSFEEAASDGTVNYAIREAIRKRGVPVEELDI